MSLALPTDAAATGQALAQSLSQGGGAASATAQAVASAYGQVTNGSMDVTIGVGMKE